MSVNDKKSYLKKYLGGPSKEKKKKKKVVKGKGFKIIDDDIDLSKLRPLDGDELDVLDQGEDAPQIAGIVDERPEEVRKLEQFKTTSKWRVVNQDDGFNSKLQIEEIQKDVKEIEKENEVIFGKMYSDSEDEKQKEDSDISPPRKKSSKDNDSDISPPRKRNRSPPQKQPSKNDDSDISPPRNRNRSPPQKQSSKNDDSDISPPRKRDRSPKRKEPQNYNPSPPRKQETRRERARKPSRWGDAEVETNTVSPERNVSRSRRSASSDISPPRKRRLSPGKNNDRRKSPSPRKDNSDKYTKSGRESSKKDKDRRDLSDRNRNTDRDRRQNSDSDASPPRKDRDRNGTGRTNNMQERDRYTSKDKRKRSPSPKSKKKYDSDSDLSPPRKDKDRRPRSPQNRQKQDSDSDLSPPRKSRSNNMSDKDRNKQRRNSDSPPPTNKKMAKTLEGKLAGLQDAKQLREENEDFRRREEEVFRRLGDSVSGRNAQAVSRKGKRDTSEDRQKQKDKAERQKELDAKYKMWSKGIKQVEAQEARIQDYMHEASKPVARHRDDKDLDRSLKQVERAGDPMLQYMREKKRERGELPPERPSYKGNYPPNRFNLRPGYRWDGVDRSNGYENKVFQHQSKRKAQEEEAYKWSTEDL